MPDALDKLREAVAVTQPAPDYAPRPWQSWSGVFTDAVIAGTASIIDPWPSVFERSWVTPPIRDRFILAGDSWRALERFRAVAMHVHPDQIQLFDPKRVK